MSKVKRSPPAPAKLPAHPMDAAKAISRYVDTVGFVLLNIRQAAELAAAMEAPAESKLRILVERIETELGKVDAIVPELDTEFEGV